MNPQERFWTLSIIHREVRKAGPAPCKGLGLNSVSISTQVVRSHPLSGGGCSLQHCTRLMLTLQICKLPKICCVLVPIFSSLFKSYPIVQAAGVPTVPGSDGLIKDEEEALFYADKV